MKWFIIVGWIAYVLTWIALFANIVNDWLTLQWISPLSIMALVIFGGSTAIQLLRREPIISISTKGMANRFLITLILVLLICVFILGRIVLNFLG